MRLSRTVRTLSASLLTMMLLLLPTSEWINPDRVPVRSIPSLDMEPATDWEPEQLNKPPNIIVVLSESFWDATQLPGLVFSRDPAPFFHSLQKRYTHGTMLSPMFGGGTANVELEVLTGHSYRFFPKDSIVYEQYIKQPTASLASLLAGQGYATTAISPFHGWFFNSSEVYKYLGFSQFISLEYFNPDEYVGPYIGDHAVARRIIEQSEQSPGSDFIFANTMENHYHYWPGKFKRNTIDVKGKVSPEAIGLTETYAQGMEGADRMLEELIVHYSRLKEPTIIVFFGDHLPSLEKYTVYEETGYITGENDPDFLTKMHEVPVVIWNNYLPREKNEKLHFSPSFLGPYVLRLAQREGSPYTDYLYDLSQKMPLVPPEEAYAEMGVDPAMVADYRSRQQAILEQEQQRADEAKARLSGFKLGYGAPEIRRVEPSVISASEDALGRTTLTVEGGRFGLGCSIFVNGKQLETAWLSESSLSAALPRELTAKPGALTVEVKVIDSKKQILAVSSPATVTVQAMNK